MELNDLLTITAGILLGGKISQYSPDGGRTWSIRVPRKTEIHAAVSVAKEIWEAVLESDKGGA